MAPNDSYQGAVVVERRLNLHEELGLSSHLCMCSGLDHKWVETLLCIAAPLAILCLQITLQFITSKFTT